MTEIILCLLGPFAAQTSSGRALVFATRKTAALLAYLALSEGSTVHRDTLRKLLWSDRDVDHGRNSLRQALRALHLSLNGAASILSDRSNIALEPGKIDLDVARFLHGANSENVAGMEASAALYRGDFLADFDIADPAFKIWRAREAAKLRLLMIETLERLLDHYSRVSPSQAVDIACRITAVDPCHEPSHRLLVAHHRERGHISAAAEESRRFEAALNASSAQILKLHPDGSQEPAVGYISSNTPQFTTKLHSPSIAVLPFTVPAADDDYAYFADGVADDILVGLSRLPWLTVIARGSTFAYRGGVDAGEVARELGVRYVLQGSIRRSGTRVRIGGRLSDSAHGKIIWADHFDSGLQDIFVSQDRITEAVLGAIRPTIEAAEIERARAKRPEDLDAWDLYLQALPFHYAMTSEGHTEAMRLLRGSLERDPKFAPALGIAAWGYTLSIPQRWGDAATDVATGLDISRRAIAAGHDDADALAMGAYGLAYLGRDFSGGLNAADRAVSLNANAARAFAFSAWIRGYVGDHETAVKHYRHALRLSPRDQIGFRTRAGLAFSLLFQGRLEEALAEAQQAHQEGPSYTPAHRVLATTLVEMGRTAEAQEITRRARAVVPDLTTSYAIAECRYTRGQDIERLRQGYLAAGLPE